MEKSIAKKSEVYQDCYQNVRKKINRWAKDGKLIKKTGKWTDYFIQYLLILPDLVHLMIKLLVDKEISSLYKSYILIALAYLVSPIDIIPDFIPITGFVDDLLVMVIILNKIINSQDKNVLNKIKKYWAGEQDIFSQVKEIVSVLNELSSRIPKALYNFIKKQS
ncbi:MAG: DUF1232 domain-containing protein [Candidatus Aminicenantes bacterium]|nr:DUF1232 domain-containing protein [Candidatus Aminicenantes bacterium]